MPKQLAYAVFTPAYQEKHWWSGFLSPQMKHCFIYARAAEGWVLANVKQNGLDILYSAEPRIHQSILRDFPGAIILPVHTREPLWPFIKLPIFSCVEALRHFIGVDEIVITPKQLYNALLSGGYLATDELPYILQEQLNAAGQI